MSSDSVCLGRVKWFDNKKGYGVICVLDGIRQGADVFAHHASIVTGEDQYRYLVSGEYVSCIPIDSVNKSIQYAASNIKGVLGGPLMCETIREQKLAKDAYDESAKQGTASVEKTLAKVAKNIVKEQKEPKEIKKVGDNNWSKVAKKGDSPSHNNKKQ